ncbi:SIR2 family protein [Clostridium cuniculi]|uniref:SIR2 family protein n=1 Tax=Clostridium cuniculi TaxID=2548455 RepID=UPI001054534C|nr:SIR2 family protein [Clostridium cuniculi]
MYLERLIVGKQIPEEVLKLANILISKEISNLVVTPNFDKFIYQALNLYGEKNILLSERPENVTKLNINSDSLNILHVHGTYEYYDCCNLKSEINDRAQEDGIFSVKSFLTNILNSMSPIIIGYSGWEGDVIMTVLRERLKMPLKYKLYWFCYDEKSYENIPEWVKYEDEDGKKLREDIVFVLPQEKLKKDSEQELLSNNELQVIDDKLTSSKIDCLEAIDIFDEMMKQFEIKLPKIVIDPIDFLYNHYKEDILNSSYKRLLLLGLDNKKEKNDDLISKIKTNIVQNDIINLLKNLNEISNKIIHYQENDLSEILLCLEIMLDAYKINKIEKETLEKIIL